MTAIRLRDDIAVQLRENRRPVVVDCRAGTRIVAEDARTWDALRALGNGDDPAGIAAELDWLAPDDVPSAAAGRDHGNEARLAELVEFARTRVPHYRRAFAHAEVPGLASLPPLTKEDLRAEFPAGLLADGFDYGALIRSGAAEVLYSSGTTIDGDRSPSLHLASEDEANHDSPFGIYDASERQARFSTPRCTGRECYIQQQARKDRTFGPNLILNSSHNPMFMSDAALRDVARELAEWEPIVLSGNPWYLAVLLRFLEREGIAPPSSVSAVVFGTEYAPAPVRRYVTERTGLIPFDNYSASEVGNIASSCPLGTHHAFDSVHVEVVRGDRPAAPGELGELLVSSLNRRAMPILRYRTGDLAVELNGCGCGLPHRALELHGRISDCLVLDDAVVTQRRLDQALAPVEGILFYRVRQAPDERVSLELCPRPDARRPVADIAADAAARIAELGLQVTAVTCTERIHARESMKFSTVICEVPNRRQRVEEGLRDARR